MDVFSIDVTPNELIFLRQALDLVTVSGKDAKFLANLQNKLETELDNIQNLKKEEEIRKQKELEEALKADALKQQSKKS